jgi:hypothetical protein
MEENNNEIKEEFKKDYTTCCTWDKKNNKNSCVSNSNCIYGIGLVGAIIYYISTATSFWIGVLGILKALVWPAFIVYEALKFFAI